MKEELDCLLVGYKELSLEERRLMAKGNIAALNYCKHEYIEYNDKFYFYDDFISEISGNIYKISELPYLGIMYLDNYLKKRNILVNTYSSFDFDKDAIEDDLNTKEIKVIALSAVFYTSPISLIRLVSYFRKKSPDSKIIVGGAYISNEYETLSFEKLKSELVMIGADYYIYDSQGEKTLYSLIEKIKKRENIDAIENIIEIREKKCIIHKENKEHNDINSDIVSYDKLSPRLQFSTINIRTARGCPNRCKFCNYPVRNPKLELQMLDNIKKQILDLYNIDRVKNVVFIDDSFNMPLNRFKDICKMMIELGSRKPWYSYFRMSHCDEEAIALMKESNCEGVFLGIESADNKVLENMNKRTTYEQYIEALLLLKKYRINTFAYFLIGFPEETDETIEKNIELLNSGLIDFYSFNLWYAENNTPIFDLKEKYKLKGEGFNWEHYTMNSVQAASKMDYIYENVENSIYIPGENFSFWGVPYLLGKGIKLQGIKEVLINIRKYILLENDFSTKYELINEMKKVLCYTNNYDI